LASFGLAVNRRWQNRQTQEWEEAVSFIDVTVWGQQAENVAQSLAKGSRVMVSGRFEQQSWEDKAGGGKRSKIVVIADEVAPSLRWATAAITRIERTDSNGPPAPVGAYSKPGVNEPPGDYHYEEEPF
jgi:single-strand DNA-binding protein